MPSNTDTGEHDAHDRVRRLDDDRVAPLAGLDAVGFDEQSCTHGFLQKAAAARL
jgi:hypothetical protein